MNIMNEIVYKTPANLPAVGRLSLAGIGEKLLISTKSSS